MAYDNAVEVVQALAGHKLNPDQDDYLAIMAKLVEDYETEHVPEPKPVKGFEALKFLLEENTLTPGDLGEILGVNHRPPPPQGGSQPHRRSHPEARRPVCRERRSLSRLSGA